MFISNLATNKPRVIFLTYFTSRHHAIYKTGKWYIRYQFSIINIGFRNRLVVRNYRHSRLKKVTNIDGFSKIVFDPTGVPEIDVLRLSLNRKCEIQTDTNNNCLHLMVSLMLAFQMFEQLHMSSADFVDILVQKFNVILSVPVKLPFYKMGNQLI
ncbi:hypothetical protein YC2023_022841 [Brassica napus]